MLSPSDFNNAVPKFTNGNYASNPLNPQYIAEPSATEYNRGAEPLQTLPAQWWNWFLNKFTGRFNKVNTYVKNIFDELTQLMSLVSMTPSGTESTPTIAQLKTMFETEYPKYMALLMYPVGSIYWTGKAPDDGGDPNVLFGGTWVQIKGRFVWAKGDSDTLNATGGSKTVTLTTDQIPSHTHTFSGSAVTSGANDRGHTHSYSHTHEYTPSGKIASSSGGTNNKTATPNDSTVTITDPGHSHRVGYQLQAYGGSSLLASIGSSYFDSNNYITNSVTTGITASHSHTHAAYFTGTKSSTTSQSTTTSGSESQNHTHSVTASGTNSYTGGPSGATAGQASAHDNMPPYVVKYCWERTA